MAETRNRAPRAAALLAIASAAMSSCSLLVETGDLSGGAGPAVEAGPFDAPLPDDAVGTRDGASNDGQAGDGEAGDAGASEGGEAGAEVFVGGLTNVTGMAHNADTLFWTEADGVRSCPLAGCASPAVVAAGGGPTVIVWDGRPLWCNGKTLGFKNDDGGVGSFDLNGNDCLWVTAQAGTRLYVNGGIIYLTGDPPSGVASIPTGLTTIVRASVYDGNLVWMTSAGQIDFCGANGGCGGSATVTVATGQACLDVALDDAAVFWSTMDGRIRAAGHNSLSITTGVSDLGTAPSVPSAIVADASGAYLYFTARGTSAANYMDGVVGRLPKAGGPVTILASSQARPEALTVTPTHVYWANTYDGTIRRTAK